MTLLVNCLCVGAGGFVGSVLRYLCGLLPIGGQSPFPYTTLLVNVVGALLIGFIAAYLGRFFAADDQVLLFLRVGLCGGFTTFSAFSLESLQLLQGGEYVSAILYIVLSVLLCLGAVLLGGFAASWFEA